jgi:hypothetical protein
LQRSTSGGSSGTSSASSGAASPAIEEVGTSDPRPLLLEAKAEAVFFVLDIVFLNHFIILQI